MVNPFHQIMVRQRADLGLSQAQAAARAQVSSSTWNGWENADELPHRDQWRGIAQALDIPIDELLRQSSSSCRLQSGPSQFQLSLLEALGISPAGSLADHTLIGFNVDQLERELDVDLELLQQPALARKLGLLRQRIRNLLVTQDATLQQLRLMVGSFRSAYDVMAPRSYGPQLEEKTSKAAERSGR